MLSDAFVHTFVAPADEDNSFQCREFSRYTLVEPAALCRQQHHTLPGIPRNALCAGLEVQSFNTFKDRFRLQHDAFAAAERAVIDGAMPVVRKLPQVADFDLCQPGFAGFADNSV